MANDLCRIGHRCGMVCVRLSVTLGLAGRDEPNTMANRMSVSSPGVVCWASPRWLVLWRWILEGTTMQRSLVRQEVVPLLVAFGSLVFATMVTDLVLHKLDLVWIGRYLGIPGTLLLLSSFLYSLRKRRAISFGSPRALLALHEAFTWLGGLMVLVHAGIHLNAILPWLALAAMLANVISGMTGRYLLGRSRRFLEAKREAFAGRGMNEEEIERQLFWDATTYELMTKWRAVHFPITLAFVGLGLSHIVSSLLFWQWK